MLARDASQVLRVVSASPRDFDMTSQDLGAAEWSEQHAEQAGRFTDTLNAAPCWMLPLGGDGNPLGVAALRFPVGQGEPSTDERSLALTMVQDIGQALQRARLAEELEGARVQGETSRYSTRIRPCLKTTFSLPASTLISSATRNRASTTTPRLINHCI